MKTINQTHHRGACTVLQHLLLATRHEKCLLSSPVLSKEGGCLSATCVKDESILVDLCLNHALVIALLMTPDTTGHKRSG